jgi:transmembrane 9 superfamily protein 2/4
MIYLSGLWTGALLIPFCANGFYLPGAAPHDYVKGEKVDLYVNALTPIMMLSSSDDSKLVRHFAPTTFSLIRDPRT